MRRARGRLCNGDGREGGAGRSSQLVSRFYLVLVKVRSAAGAWTRRVRSFIFPKVGREKFAIIYIKCWTIDGVKAIVVLIERQTLSL